MKLKITILVDSDEEVSGCCDLPGIALGYMLGDEGKDYILSDVEALSTEEYEKAPRVFDEFGGI